MDKVTYWFMGSNHDYVLAIFIIDLFMELQTETLVKVCGKENKTKCFSSNLSNLIHVPKTPHYLIGTIT